MATYKINDDVVFTIEKGVLTEVDIYNNIDTLIIPDKIEDQEIHAIGSGFIFLAGYKVPDHEGIDKSKTFKNHSYKINTLILNDNITSVSEAAFFEAIVLNVVWSKGCKTIPASCFVGSIIKSVTNIDDVETIKMAAFQSTKELKEISWPQHCFNIPDSCFYNSGIKYIYGIENVKTVGANAFNECKNLKELLFGYDLNYFHYTAFSSCFLKKMDMRTSSLVDMELFNYIKQEAEANSAEYLLPYFLED